MGFQQWQLLSAVLATLWQGQIQRGQRGAMMTYLKDHDDAIAVVFGCDGAAGAQAGEVLSLRHRLRDGYFEELALGLSPDHTTWVLVVKADSEHYDNDVAETFHQEMIQARLLYALEGPELTLAC